MWSTIARVRARRLQRGHTSAHERQHRVTHYGRPQVRIDAEHHRDHHRGNRRHRGGHAVGAPTSTRAPIHRATAQGGRRGGKQKPMSGATIR